MNLVSVVFAPSELLPAKLVIVLAGKGGVGIKVSGGGKTRRFGRNEDVSTICVANERRTDEGYLFAIDLVDALPYTLPYTLTPHLAPCHTTFPPPEFQPKTSDAAFFGHVIRHGLQRDTVVQKSMSSQCERVFF